MTLFMNTYSPEEISPHGWHNWGKTENEDTARFMEFNNKGSGANISERVKWDKILATEQSKHYTIEKVLKGYDNWDFKQNKKNMLESRFISK